MVHPLVYPILSLVALLSAPAIYRLSRGSKVARELLRGVVGGVVSVLILVHVLPDAYQVAGPWTSIAFLVGAVLPGRFESLLARGGKGSSFALILGVVGILGHSLLDGVGLGNGGEHGEHLQMAIVLHKLPMGLLLWMLAQPRVGALKAWGLLIMVGAATLLGFAMGPLPIPGQALGLISAFIGGTLVHIVASHRQGQGEGGGEDTPGELGGSSKVMGMSRWELLGGVLGGIISLVLG